MDFMTKLERKFGKYSIPNLTIILIAGFILGYFIAIFDSSALAKLSLNPAMVVRGQVWRLITWIVMPPRSLGPLVIIMLFFYFSIGRTLERSWGDFRYTVYIISGIIFTDIGVMLTYVVMLLTGQPVDLAGGMGVSTYYLCMSMFLAYAFMFPDMQVLLYFVIPIRVKWLGYLDIAYLIYEVLICGLFHDYAGMVTVIMSVLNFFIFYFASRRKSSVSRTHKKKIKNYRREVRQTQILTRHKCAICGQTEEDNPSLEFRYCSRCKGNYEYCNNHLFTHEHKK